MSANKKPVNRIILTVTTSDNYTATRVVHTRGASKCTLQYWINRVMTRTPNAVRAEAEYLKPICTGF